jgi:hypothetical protein
MDETTGSDKVLSKGGFSFSAFGDKKEERRGKDEIEP